MQSSGASNTNIATEFVILRKTAYGDTSLIVAGLAPELGRISVLVRGGRRLGRKNYPVADLFRHLQLQARPGRGELYTWCGAEIAADYSALALAPNCYRAAGWLARFALANIALGSEARRPFAATVLALRRLAALAQASPAVTAATSLAVLTCCSAVFADDAGVLPHYEDAPEHQQQQQRRMLLLAGAGDCAPSRLAAAQWRQLWQGLHQLLVQADFIVPELPY